MKIAVRNSTGLMEITATGPLERKYSWPSATKTFRLTGRTKRWYGSLGAYAPQGDGTMHAVLEEGQQHFDTLDGVAAWLAKKCTWKELVWSSEGLVVGWKEDRRPSDGYIALSVDVWQIYLSGRKPSHLRGASDLTLTATGGSSAKNTSFKLPPARRISGKLFAGRALSLMEDHHISVEEVLAVIRKATSEKEGRFWVYSGHYLDPKINCSVCTNSAGDILSAEP
ncbi:MAG: hypothetical protein NTV80_09100 [Verrucomicrobia bacterium]|nr:hypothetical protein [Verrucomicrobiota bacterium]